MTFVFIRNRRIALLGFKNSNGEFLFFPLAISRDGVRIFVYFFVVWIFKKKFLKTIWKWKCSSRIYDYQLWGFKIKTHTKILHNCTHHQPHSSWKVRMKRRLTLKEMPVMELQVNHFQSPFYEKVWITSHCCVEKSLNLFDKNVNWKFWACTWRKLGKMSITILILNSVTTFLGQI